MQEEAVPISEEEASDSEIVMVSQTQTYSRQPEEIRLTERRLRSQEGMIDNQLKALGLYEEGLSFEQKEELLAVVAVSRQTAEQEESMRVRAKEWQQKILSEDLEFEASTSLIGRNEAPTSPTYVAAMPAGVEGSLQLLNIESCSTPGSSQDLFEITEVENIPSRDVIEHSQGSQSFGLGVGSEMRDAQCKRTATRRGRGRRGARGRCQSGDLRMSHSFIIQQTTDISELEDGSTHQVDFRKQRRDLEKSMPEWKPCLSPETESLQINRSLQEGMKVSHCFSEEDSCESLLQSIEDYHIAVDKLQRNSITYIPWGQPVTVGRAYATRSARTRMSDLENSDGFHTFQPSSNISDETLHIDDNVTNRYLRLRQFDKLFQSSPESNGMNASKTMKISAPVNQRVTSEALLPKRTRNSIENVKTQNKNVDIIFPIDVKENTDVNMPGSSTNECLILPTRLETLMCKTSSDGNKYEEQMRFNMPLSNFPSPNARNATEGETEKNDSDLVVRKDGQKTYSARKHSPQKSSTVPRVRRDFGRNDLIENSPPVVIDPASPWKTKAYIPKMEKNVTKRKRLSSNFTKVSSPSKRLKESGAV